MTINTDRPEKHPEVDLFDVLAGRVRVGEPIHVIGKLEGPVGLLHLATIRRLRTVAGCAVQVIYC